MAFKTFTKQVWKGSVLTSPVPPTLVTCEHNGIRNVFTVAWTGILCTQPPVTYISIRPERYSYELISESGEFVINLATEELTKAVDICGIKSGRKLDKFAHLGLTCEKASKVGAPILAQSPVNIECKVREVVKLGTHDMFIADVVGVTVDEKLLDEKGAMDLKKANLIAYSHGEYFELGEKIGKFGYSVQKKTDKKTPKKDATTKSDKKTPKKDAITKSDKNHTDKKHQDKKNQDNKGQDKKTQDKKHSKKKDK